MIKPFETPHMQLEDDQEVEDASGLDTHFDNAEVSDNAHIQLYGQVTGLSPNS